MSFGSPNRAATTASLAWLLASITPPALAELGGTVSIQSDARDRGLSYSDDKPAAQLTLAYDGNGGWYGGGTAMRAKFSEHSSNVISAYGGRVVNLAPGLDAEAGLQFNHYASITRYDFGELYAGLLGERWSARLHYANDYYGTGQHSVYGELNFNWPLRKTLMASAHLGALNGSRGDYGITHGDTRFDSRLGLAWQVQSVELQLSWVAVSRGGPYTWMTERRRNALVLGLSTSF
ncbi:TorF family putative porin [Paucibacter sp. R3-3]|uniref:TorF family putative porin n=1 Tax=Roseateles agri TaxID=3098619 RepID=A0ABU5DR33_9BURK|nr:TorF family putative porin [Paucibacter sp. R3-3]MDY0748781.1 TorF family putative porin [Paucibacter sp. R3-3]